MVKISDLAEQAEVLQVRIAALDADAKPVREQLGNIDRQKSKLNAELSILRSQIADAKKTPRVSDHAVIRYLERKHGFDFEGVRNGLLTDTVRAALEAGLEGVKIDGGTLKLRDKTVTTFIAAAGKEVPKSRRRAASCEEAREAA